jgi:hypothetical protein
MNLESFGDEKMGGWSELRAAYIFSYAQIMLIEVQGVAFKTFM